MKDIKLPKKIQVGSYAWTIKRDKSGGGYFDCDEQVIGVGTQVSPERQWEMFLHELVEAILADNFMRYALPHDPKENGDYLFSYDHVQHENAVRMLAGALWPLFQG